MARTKIDAREAVRDVRAGMSDDEIMANYNISPAGLQDLLNKLVKAGMLTESELMERLAITTQTVVFEPDDFAAPSPAKTPDLTAGVGRKIRLDAREVVDDIRSGMRDLDLMRKYSLSALGLDSLFKKLVESGIMDQTTLEELSLVGDQSARLDRYVCPACNMPQFYKFETCPQCGVIVSKFLKKKAEDGGAVKAPTIIPIPVPTTGLNEAIRATSAQTAATTAVPGETSARQTAPAQEFSSDELSIQGHQLQDPIATEVPAHQAPPGAMTSQQQERTAVRAGHQFSRGVLALRTPNRSALEGLHGPLGQEPADETAQGPLGGAVILSKGIDRNRIIRALLSSAIVIDARHGTDYWPPEGSTGDTSQSLLERFKDAGVSADLLVVVDDAPDPDEVEAPHQTLHRSDSPELSSPGAPGDHARRQLVEAAKAGNIGLVEKILDLFQLVPISR